MTVEELVELLLTQVQQHQMLNVSGTEAAVLGVSSYKLVVAINIIKDEHPYKTVIVPVLTEEGTKTMKVLVHKLARVQDVRANADDIASVTL